MWQSTSFQLIGWNVIEQKKIDALKWFVLYLTIVGCQLSHIYASIERHFVNRSLLLREARKKTPKFLIINTLYKYYIHLWWVRVHGLNTNRTHLYLHRNIWSDETSCAQWCRQVVKKNQSYGPLNVIEWGSFEPSIGNWSLYILIILNLLQIPAKERFCSSGVKLFQRYRGL